MTAYVVSVSQPQSWLIRRTRKTRKQLFLLVDVVAHSRDFVAADATYQLPAVPQPSLPWFIVRRHGHLDGDLVTVLDR